MHLKNPKLSGLVIRALRAQKKSFKLSHKKTTFEVIVAIFMESQVAIDSW